MDNCFSKWLCYFLYSISGPVLMVEMSYVLPLTVRCLSLLPGFESRLSHLRKLPVILGFKPWFLSGTAQVTSVIYNWLVMTNHIYIG